MKFRTCLSADMFLVVFFVFFALSHAFHVYPEIASESPFEPVSAYQDNTEMSQFLSQLSNKYSNLSVLYSLGRSVGGKELWVLRITSPSSPIIGAPNVKFVGNIHGNEPVGRELILSFAEHLLRNYETDPEVKWLLDTTVIHLLPSLNPDGFEKSREGICYSGPGRENGNSVDLNRSFPDEANKNKIPLQPENTAVIEWMSRIPFVLSASFHGGALVANYPFDSNLGNAERELLASRSSLTPDDDVFKHLAQVYSNNHPHMHKGRTCNENQPSFPGGITNGAAWYSFTGGMQDYNYVAHGCMELTLEISCCKYPQSNHLPRLWAENKRAMLEFAKQSQMGVKGLVVDKITSATIAGAKLHISGRHIPFFTSEKGEFWRILLPGNYLLIVEARGYEIQSFPFTVENQNASYPSPTWLSIYLQPVTTFESAPSNLIQIAENSSSASLSISLPVIFAVTVWTLS